MKQQDSCRIAAFTGGALEQLEGFGEGREVVLALPLSRLIVKMIRVPNETDPVEFAAPILQKMSPFPDETLTVGFETVREAEDGRVIVAAALPESAADDIGEALDAAKLSVRRIDALVFGLLRGMWSEIAKDDDRRLVLVRGRDCVSIVVLDGDGPSAIRSIPTADELKREVMLSLLEAEDFGGMRKLSEVVVVEPEGFDEVKSDEADAESPAEAPEAEPAPPAAEPAEDPFEALGVFAPVRRISVGSQAALVGIAERSREEGGLDAMPESWREVLEESRFKKKLSLYMAITGGIWLLIMGVLIGVPIVYGYMTDYQKGLSKKHSRQYRAVEEMKAKVELIQKYSDHAHGSLEIMKAISDRLPEDIILSSWNYRRDEGLLIAGDSESAEAVYEFKDIIDTLSDGENGEGERIFQLVELKGPNLSRGKQHFELNCQYKPEDEQ